MNSDISKVIDDEKEAPIVINEGSPERLAPEQNLDPSQPEGQRLVPIGPQGELRPAWYGNWARLQQGGFINLFDGHTVQKVEFDRRFRLHMPVGPRGGKPFPSQHIPTQVQMPAVAGRVHLRGRPRVVQHEGQLFFNTWCAKNIPTAKFDQDFERLAMHWLNTAAGPRGAQVLLAWMAHMVQRPDEKLQWALTLSGESCVGKSSVVEIVRVARHEHEVPRRYCRDSPRYVRCPQEGIVLVDTVFSYRSTRIFNTVAEQLRDPKDGRNFALVLDNAPIEAPAPVAHLFFDAFLDWAGPNASAVRGALDGNPGAARAWLLKHPIPGWFSKDRPPAEGMLAA